MSLSGYWFRFLSKNKKIIYTLSLISIVVILGNVISVFGLSTLLNDDQYRYINALENTIPMHLAKRNFLIPYPIYFFMELATISPYLSRGVIVVTVVAPVSIMFFLLYYRYFRLRLAPSLVAACLPNILPGQYMLPHFMDGCYTYYGLFFAMPALIMGIEYLQKGALLSWKLLVSSILFLVSAMLMDHVVFLFFPFAIVFLSQIQVRRKVLILISIFGIIAGSKLFYLLNNPWETSTPVTLSAEVILNRLILYFQYVTPYPLKLISWYREGMWLYVPVLCVIISIGWFILFLYPDKLLRIFREKTDRGHRIRQVLFLFTFCIVLMVATFAPFLVSPYFSSRYAHISSFGFCLLLVLAIYSLVTFSIVRSKANIVILSCVLILVPMIGRNLVLSQFFAPSNRGFDLIIHDLKHIYFPKDSQLVLLGATSIATGGYWNWSSGFLKFALERPDIDGIMSKELSYYDPFKMDRSFSSTMTGLDIERPVFIYRKDKSTFHFVQKEYGLRWHSPNGESTWEVLRFDKLTGHSTPYAKGKGYASFQSFIKELPKSGLNQTEIVWGMAPEGDDIKRLGLISEQ